MDFGSLAYKAPDGGTYGALPLITSNQTFYVSTSGNDSTGNGTASKPWATIQKALTHLQGFAIAPTAYVTIALAQATFTQTTTLTLSHPQGRRCILQGTTNQSSAIGIGSANTTVINFAGTNTGINVVGEWGSIQQCLIVGGTSGSYSTAFGLYGLGNGYSCFCNIYLCYFQYWTCGIYADFGSHILCSNVAATHTTAGCFYADFGGRITTATSFAYYSSSYGVVAIRGGAVRCDGMTITGNTGAPMYAYETGFIYAPSVTLSSNGNSNTPSPAYNTVGNYNSIIMNG